VINMKTYIGPATAQLQDGTTVNLKAPHQVTRSEIASAYAALRVERRMGTKHPSYFGRRKGDRKQ